MSNNISKNMQLSIQVKEKISHNIGPVIGHLRLDASEGRDDADQTRLHEYWEKLDKAVADIVKMIEEMEK